MLAKPCQCSPSLILVCNRGFSLSCISDGFSIVISVLSPCLLMLHVIAHQAVSLSSVSLVNARRAFSIVLHCRCSLYTALVSSSVLPTWYRRLKRYHCVAALVSASHALSMLNLCSSPLLSPISFFGFTVGL
ncbi:unnamed protein product [Prunus armeniaca]